MNPLDVMKAMVAWGMDVANGFYLMVVAVVVLLLAAVLVVFMHDRVRLAKQRKAEGRPDRLEQLVRDALYEEADHQWLLWGGERDR